MDYVSIMSYDYYGPWSSVLGHNSPLYVPAQDRNSAGLNLLSQVLMLFCRDFLQRLYSFVFLEISVSLMLETDPKSKRKCGAGSLHLNNWYLILIQKNSFCVSDKGFILLKY